MSTVRFDLDRHVCHNLVRGGAVTEADALVFWTLAYSAATGRDPDLGEVRLRDLGAHVRTRSAWPHPLRALHRPRGPAAASQDGCGGMAPHE